MDSVDKNLKRCVDTLNNVLWHMLQGCTCSALTMKGNAMLYTIAVVLLVLWLLGLVSAYTIGGFIHVLLVIAIVLVLLRIISGRKPM